jgi:hypothetical protein
VSTPFTDHSEAEVNREREQIEREHGKVPMVENDEGKWVPATEYLDTHLFPGIAHVVKSSHEEPQFVVVWQPPATDGKPPPPQRRFTVGDTAKLRSPTALSDLVAEVTDEYPDIKTATAKRIGTALRKLAKPEDGPSTPLDECRAWVAGFMDNSLTNTLDLTDGEQRKLAATSRAIDAFTTPGKQLHLRDAAFLHYLRAIRRISEGRVSNPEVRERLKRLGFKVGWVSAPREGKRDNPPKRKYWVSEPGYDWESDG